MGETNSSRQPTIRTCKFAESTKVKKAVNGHHAMEERARTMQPRNLISPPVPTSKDVAGGDVVLSKRPVSATSDSLTTSLVPAPRKKAETLSTLTSISASAQTVSATALNILT